MTDKEELGARLKKARENAGMKQVDVCQNVDIPKVQTLSAYERGVNSPPFETLKKLAKLYKISTDWLLFGENNIPAAEKSPLDYVKQLVDAADHLNLTFNNWEDYYSHENVIVLALLSSPYEGMGSFVEKWSRLRDLLDNGIIEQDEYDGLISQKLNALILTEKTPQKKIDVYMNSDGELPF